MYFLSFLYQNILNFEKLNNFFYLSQLTDYFIFKTNSGIIFISQHLEARQHFSENNR